MKDRHGVAGGIYSSAYYFVDYLRLAFSTGTAAGLQKRRSLFVILLGGEPRKQWTI
jgi:hypothetical protein